ncbi:MAG: L,D-transpeptidase [Alloprevotella sp.]|nr:L,D-transpeptidase [Alloprevotella sp.]
MRYAYILLLGLAFAACSNKEGTTTPAAGGDDTLSVASAPDAGVAPVQDNAATTAPATEAGAQAAPATGDAHLYYTGKYDKQKSYIVISKRDLRLYVYADVDGAPRLLADYPCCLSRNKGQKQRRGDNKTPESPAGKPFKIQQIQDASTWRHDFHDGRGNILAYGHWFLRLLTPGHTGIGIHGSTNNESSVPGRASEGCIRLLDKDIIHLKETFAFVGMPVTIQAEGEGHLPFMDKARKDEAKPVVYKQNAAAKKDTARIATPAAGSETPQIQDPGKQYHAR